MVQRQALRNLVKFTEEIEDYEILFGRVPKMVKEKIPTDFFSK